MDVRWDLPTAAQDMGPRSLLYRGFLGTYVSSALLRAQAGFINMHVSHAVCDREGYDIEITLGVVPRSREGKAGRQFRIGNDK